MRSLLLLSVLAFAAAPPKGAGPGALFKSAIEDFEFGEHAVAAEKLRKLLEPPLLENKEDVIVARQYLGACYHLLDDKEKAKAQFSMLLALDPQHKLDPEVFSPALVEFFEQVRTETGLGLAGRTQNEGTRARERPVKGAAPGSESVRTELDPGQGRARPPLALAFVPFGVGQFNNRQPVRGALFAAGEIGLFATAAATFVMFNNLKLPDEQRDQRCVPSAACFKNKDDADRASTLQTLYLVSFWSGLALAAIGVAEALISYPGEVGIDGASGPSSGARPRAGARSLGSERVGSSLGLVGPARYGLEIRF